MQDILDCKAIVSKLTKSVVSHDCMGRRCMTVGGDDALGYLLRNVNSADLRHMNASLLVSHQCLEEVDRRHRVWWEVATNLGRHEVCGINHRIGQEEVCMMIDE